ASLRAGGRERSRDGRRARRGEGARADGARGPRGCGAARGGARGVAGAGARRGGASAGASAGVGARGSAVARAVASAVSCGGAFVVAAALVFAGFAGFARSASAQQAPLTPPRAIDAGRVPYPSGAHGAASVVVELVVDREGRVREVRVL